MVRGFALLLATLLVALQSVLASQLPFSASYDEQTAEAFGSGKRIELPLDPMQAASMNGASIEGMIAAQNGKHVTLTHRDFPQMSVRMKRVSAKQVNATSFDAATFDAFKDKSDPNAFCDPTVTSWSGYVDMLDGKSLFFYFFESRSKPDSDPIMLWLNGGPGCSSSMGLFMELGPCRIPERGGKRADGPPINGTEWNPYSWNNQASVFFLDQPIEVGYSYSRYGLHTHNSEQAGRDVYAFLRVFFEAFTRFQGNDFIIAGESYGGRYLPRFAAEIVSQNHAIAYAAERKGKEPKKGEIVNLKKLAIGNGLTDAPVQVPRYYDFVCTRAGGLEPMVDALTCKDMLVWREKCIKLFKKNCLDTYDPEECQATSDTCSQRLEYPYMETGRNPYNALDLCKAGYSPNLCYDVTEDIRNYLDREDVRQLLGAEPVDKIGKFQSCNMEVASGFSAFHDSLFNNGDYVSLLLERSIEILIYVGKLDWICNWVGNKAWVDTLLWTESDSFHGQKERKWIVDGKPVGDTRSGGGLTWATVEGAGHMVPYDQPKAALAMINRFLDGDKL